MFCQNPIKAVLLQREKSIIYTHFFYGIQIAVTSG